MYDQLMEVVNIWAALFKPLLLFKTAISLSVSLLPHSHSMATGVVTLPSLLFLYPTLTSCRFGSVMQYYIFMYIGRYCLNRGWGIFRTPPPRMLPDYQLPESLTVGPVGLGSMGIGVQKDLEGYRFPILGLSHCPRSLDAVEKVVNKISYRKMIKWHIHLTQEVVSGLLMKQKRH